MALKLIVLGLLSQLVKVNFQIYTRKTSPTIQPKMTHALINDYLFYIFIVLSAAAGIEMEIYYRFKDRRRKSIHKRPSLQ